MCLLATKGKPKRKSKSVRQLVVDDRREHSRKPDNMYNYIEELLDGPYIELFARNTHPGWDSWGNETTKHDGE
jgi:N6-adenosine-specific RNA methylase IME4